MSRWRKEFDDPDLLAETRKKVLGAFKTLRRQKIRARANFWCCQSCAGEALDLKKRIGGVFWHNQDEEGFKETGELYIAFCTESGEGAGKIGEALTAALKAEHLWVEWDGSAGTRVLVKARAAG